MMFLRPPALLGLPSVRALLACVLCVSALAVGPPDADAQAETDVAAVADDQQWQAPTFPGAPFIPDQQRSQHVLARYEALTALSELEQAQRNLALRLSNALSSQDSPNGRALTETSRILDAQISARTRTLAELEEQQAALIEDTADLGISGIAIFPVDEARKPFWDDWGQPRSGGRRHIGTDVLAQVGVPLRAIEDGEVESITSGGLGGNGIFLLGDSGSRYLYVHMQTVAELEPGERVLAGQPVGTVGDTGNASGAPHLHMQWAPNGGADWQNPFPVLDVLFGEGRTEMMMAEAQQAQESGSSEG